MARVSENLKNPFEKEKPEPKPDVKPVEGSEDVEVKLRSADDDDDESDDDDGDSSTADDEPRPTARQRRVNKYKEEKEGRAAAERRAAELERERDEWRMRASAPAPGSQKSLDEQYKEALKEIYDEKKKLATAYEEASAKGPLNEYQKDMFWRRHQELEVQSGQITSRYAQIQSQGYQQQTQAGPQQQALMTWLQLEHSDVLQHPQGRAVLMAAQAEEARLVSGGAPKDMETAKKAMNAAKLQFGLLKRPAPTETQRQRYSGGHSGAGSSGASPGGNNGTMTLNKRQQEMAEARYPDLPPAKAHSKWAHGPGQKMLQNKRA